MSTAFQKTIAGGAGTAAALLAGTVLFAQGTTPPATPGSQPTGPSAASTPSQRAVTKSPSGEAATGTGSTSPSAASTPQQKQQLQKKHHKTKKAATPAPSP